MVRTEDRGNYERRHTGDSTAQKSRREVTHWAQRKGERSRRKGVPSTVDPGVSPESRQHPRRSRQLEGQGELTKGVPPSPCATSAVEHSRGPALVALEAGTRRSNWRMLEGGLQNEKRAGAAVGFRQGVTARNRAREPAGLHNQLWSTLQNEWNPT